MCVAGRGTQRTPTRRRDGGGGGTASESSSVGGEEKREPRLEPRRMLYNAR